MAVSLPFPTDAARDPGMLRRRMVTEQIAARGVGDARILEAMATVPREQFVPPELAGAAFDDRPLPIGDGQTLSQPYIVARMAEALELHPGDRVLEIGTGSGYAAAVLAALGAEVHTVERIEPLGRAARDRLRRLGYARVHVHLGDGSDGLARFAPFDAIAVAAAAPAVPPALVAQLAPRGRLVLPLGDPGGIQVLTRFTRLDDGRLEREQLEPVRFVPLLSSISPDQGSGPGWRRPRHRRAS